MLAFLSKFFFYFGTVRKFKNQAFFKPLYPDKPHMVTSSRYFNFDIFLSILPHKFLVILI